MKVQVMTIKTHTESSKSELSSRGKRPFKVSTFCCCFDVNAAKNNFFSDTKAPRVAYEEEADQAVPKRVREHAFAVHVHVDFVPIVGVVVLATEPVKGELVPLLEAPLHRP